MLTVSKEICQISYGPHPFSPGQYVQTHAVTATEGLVHNDNDNKYRDEPFRLPLTDAHRNGFVDPDGDQFVEFKPIKTVIESVRARCGRARRLLLSRRVAKW